MPCSPRIAFFDNPVRAPYILSFNRQLLMIGTQSASNSCKASQAVSMARESLRVRVASMAYGLYVIERAARRYAHSRRRSQDALDAIDAPRASRDA